MHNLTSKNQKDLAQIFYIQRLKGFILKPKVYEITFASFIITCVFIPPIFTARNLVNVNQLNDYVTLSIIDDF